jgi:hypothetical protein
MLKSSLRIGSSLSRMEAADRPLMSRRIERFNFFSHLRERQRVRRPHVLQYRPRRPIPTGGGCDGATVFKHACALGCEGIVSKRLTSPYRSGRVEHWLKIKNPAAPAVKREADGRQRRMYFAAYRLRHINAWAHAQSIGELSNDQSADRER